MRIEIKETKPDKKNGFNLLKEKVPEFRSPLKTMIIIIIGLLIFLSIMIFYW
jgi:hypothetical protein